MVHKTVYLRHNLIALRRCAIILNEEGEINNYSTSRPNRSVYSSVRTDAKLLIESSGVEDYYLDIYWPDQIIPGNNQQVLLEQLEHAGIRIPYSCRAGICGCCRIKLVEGKVRMLKKLAIGEKDIILCCICVPQTSVQLAPY